MKIEYQQNSDGRWLAKAPQIPGARAFGESREEAISKVKVLALRIFADQLEKGNPLPQLNHVFRSNDWS
ncbi:type II toxin-antitoxin system HicB family antitoxin [Luteolibacter yonseiensis]|uniref:Type II toxin-antitoxin system HicB family antitoxin n=1 Tax=Luteolibacter yonseiensis TaxID=1144680 RepID=A0A934VBA5_9BACT|nr:type II toxin-antitoxin system HicB family antitoxin [Luteolibacter yonseiensis]MBK1817058.1 type II toxin-antitoxin system HicB family antitoxin [Luteolibacter yonseiensis]